MESVKDVQFFKEDEVFKINKKGEICFGMVLDNAESSSLDDLDSDSDVENEKLSPGNIRVVWHPSGIERILPEKKVHLADRSLMPGDVVKRFIKGQETQRGYCREIFVEASVEILSTNQVILGVSSNHLASLSQFTEYIAVCLGPWIGLIKYVHSNITVLFPDNSSVIVTEESLDELEDVNENCHGNCEFNHDSYYPGQVLKGPLKSLCHGEWIHCTPQMKKLRSSRPNTTVEISIVSLEISRIAVHWQCHALDSENEHMEQPPFFIVGEELKKIRVLNVFEPCTLQVGDRNFYTIKENDVIVSKNEWKLLESKIYVQSNVEENGVDDEEDFEQSNPSSRLNKKKSNYKTYKMKKKSKKNNRQSSSSFHKKHDTKYKAGDRVVVETLVTKSKATVVWQDGTIEKNVFSNELYPIHHLDDQEFFCGDFVVKASNHELHRYGVIQNVDHDARICKVKWFTTYTTGQEPHPIEENTTEEPVYDLRDHPDFQSRPGTIVIRVANFSESSKQGYGGQVLDNYPSGQVLIRWANNETSFAWPQDLYMHGEYDSDEGELWADSEDSDSNDENESGSDSWETLSSVSIQNEENENTTTTSTGIDETSNLLLKLSQQIENARIETAKLEDYFKEASGVQISKVVNTFLEVYTICKNMDEMMNTTFFDPSHFDGLIDVVKNLTSDPISTTQYAMKHQVNRLFSLSGHDDDLKSNEFNSQNIFTQLYSVLKVQLRESYNEMKDRVGSYTASSFSSLPVDNDDWNDVINNGGLQFPHDSSPPSPKEEESSVFSPIKPIQNGGEFLVVSNAPSTHKFQLSLFLPSDSKNFLKFVRNEIKLLKTSLPSGILVKSFEDRMDLYSVMIIGPAETPYENGLFFFDFHLSSDYPKSPPLCHYISYSTDKLNPNLYEDGKVCVSLLGTWSGSGTETWTSNSNLLQLLVSIQGLILVREPYFNEAGYERQRGTQQGKDNSRKYNEMALLKLVQSMTNIFTNPPPLFAEEIHRHARSHGKDFIERLDKWRHMSLTESCTASSESLPKFPLLPASKGFCISLEKALLSLKSLCEKF